MKSFVALRRRASTIPQPQRWVLALGFGGAATLAALPMGMDGRSIVALSSSCVLLASLGTALIRRRRATDSPWRWIVTSGLLFVTASVVNAVSTTMPSIPGTILYAVGYLCLIHAAGVARRLRAPEPDPGGLVDGLVLACAAGAISWAAVLSQYLQDPTLDTWVRSTNLGFWILTLSMIVAATRLAVGPGTRNVSYYLVAIAVGITFVADTATVVASSRGESISSFALLLNPLVFSFFTAAGLHPSVDEVSKQASQPVTAITNRRVALLAGALILSPSLLIWQASDPDTNFLAGTLVASAILSMLVLARLGLIIRAGTRQARIEGSLRDAAAGFVSLSDKTDMHRLALSTVDALLAPRLEPAACIVTRKEDDGYHIDGATGPLGLSAGTTISWTGLPHQIKRVIGGHAPGSVDREAGAATTSINPLWSHNEMRGALVVETAHLLDHIDRQALEALANSLSLSTEGADLIEDLHQIRSEKRFRALVENSTDIILVVDQAGSVVFASPAISTVLGYSEEDVVGHEVASLLHPDDVESWWHPDVPSHETQHHRRLIRVRHQNLDYRWFDVYSKDLGDDPDIGGIVFTCHDVTDRRRAEQAVADSEARFRALVQNVSDVVAVLDDTGRVTYVSPAIETMLGYRIDEIVGQPVHDLMHPEDLAELSGRYAVFQSGPMPSELDVRTLDTRVRTAHGDWRTVDVTITDLRDDDSVGGVVLNARDVTVKKELEESLRDQALHDGLTGLPNRVNLVATIEALAQSPERSQTASLLFIDVDDFKTINDSLGHAIGDSLLMAVADRLGQAVPPGALPARLGGDEFAVLVDPGLVAEDPEHLAARLLDVLRQPYHLVDRHFGITASIGVARVDQDDPSTEVVLRNADLAMYLAKESGKDRLELFEPSMHALATERLDLKEALARAINEGELRLVYQPIVSLQTGRITAVEALVRWDHPTRGRLRPDTFIPLAEETGLIVDLGQWVTNEASQQLRSWELSLPAGAAVSVAVNLSVRQLERPTIVEELTEVVDRYGVPPNRLTFEVTESLLMADVERSTERLRRLHSGGFQLAIDDFGSGYSALGYLEVVPLDTLKIDRSFVTRLEEIPNSPIIRAIIEMAQRLGVKVVAEGIERRSQLRILQGLGCDLGQGYLLARPTGGDEILPMLVESIERPGRLLEASQDISAPAQLTSRPD